MKWEDVKKGDYVMYDYITPISSTKYISRIHTVTKMGIKYDDFWASDHKLYAYQSILFNNQDEFVIIDVHESFDVLQLKHAELFI